jgi:glycosyltransferase involved in cell wall biosynthesis
MRRVYIVLSAEGVGGAEKRFTAIWRDLSAAGMDIHLVMPRRTLEGLVQQKEYASGLAGHPKLHLLDAGGNSYRAYVKALWEFFDGQPRAAVIHYPLAYVPGLQRRFGHRLVVSWVNNAMPAFGRKGLKNALTAWAGFLSADHVDVLNPHNLRRMCTVPGMRRKATLTAGGTHIDARLYKPLAKELDFVFLGRIEPEKQSLRFVQSLPEVHRLLRQWGYDGYRFVVCGEGSESGAVAKTAGSAEYRDLPLSVGYTTAPESILGRASVFFSLQRTSNYPSRALAEAMACGAFPILTRTGESALMVEGCSHHAFVPGDFAPLDIATALRGFLERPPEERQAVTEHLAEFARKRFSIGQQAAYFGGIYRSVGQD